MKWKVLVLDVDGTLLNEQQAITSRTKAALLKVQQLGIKLVLATGRPTHGVFGLAKALEMDLNGGYILTYNGALIIQMDNNERVFERQVAPDFIPYLAKEAAKRKCPLFTYQNDTIWTNDSQNPHIVQEAALNGMVLKQVDDFAGAVDFASHKCMLVHDNEQVLAELETRWKKRLAGSLDVFRSEPFFLEVVPQFVDKANTLSVLLELLQVPSAQVMAIGDGVCDVTMLQLAGLGIAMQHAPESVKACADDVTLSNNNDGVAAAVEKHILAEVYPSAIPLDQLNASARHALMGNLGIQFTYTSETRIEATMPVDHRTRQPFGILHGGATLALAETVAGLGSMLISKPDEFMVGMQVSGNHVSSAHEGDTVRAVGTILHKGQSSHVWNVDVFTSTDKLVSSVRVLNSIMKKR